MANWYGMSRTNYFRVKDESAFYEWAETLDAEVINDDEGRFGLLGNDEGYFPSSRWDEESGEYADVDFPTELIDHLEDGEVVVFITVGNEKSRYGTGVADAYNSQGWVGGVSIDDIYDLVAQKTGTKPTRAEY